MKLIAGLGNIGEKYFFTRHNVGFMVVDKWAYKNDLTFREDKKLKSMYTKFRFQGEDIIIIKPTTFMNLSGESISAVANYYKINLEDILIIYDDISIDLGKLRFRAKGSDGGHNGIKSVIKHLGTSNFVRLKIGIGPQPNMPSENFVLQNFPQSDQELLKNTLIKAIDAVEYYIINGTEKSQNMFN